VNNVIKSIGDTVTYIAFVMRRSSAGDRDSIAYAGSPSQSPEGALDRSVLPSIVRDTHVAVAQSRVQPSASRGVRFTSLHSVLLGAACVHALALIFWNLSAHRDASNHSWAIGSILTASVRLLAPVAMPIRTVGSSTPQLGTGWMEKSVHGTMGLLP